MKKIILLAVITLLVRTNLVHATEQVNIARGSISSGLITKARIKEAGTSSYKPDTLISIGNITGGTVMSASTLSNIPSYKVSGVTATASLADAELSNATIANPEIKGVYSNDKLLSDITPSEKVVIVEAHVVKTTVSDTTFQVSELNKPASAKAESIVSLNDNYNNDCFGVVGSVGDFKKDDWLYVVSQEKRDTDHLNVVKVKKPTAPFFMCDTDAVSPSPVQHVSAEELIKNGAQRTGWVYGALILPYKYHFDDKSFSSEVSIGPYLGRRSTLSAVSYIWAVTAGLTPLSVDSVDQNGNKKSTTLTAFTYAAGLMFELNKGASPFRAGIFFGRDVVSSDSAVTYKHDRKNWMAFQLGYDFVAK